MTCDKENKVQVMNKFEDGQRNLQNVEIVLFWMYFMLTDIVN